MRKKVFTSVAVLALSFMMCACGSEKESNSASANNESSSVVMVKTGVTDSSSSEASSNTESSSSEPKKESSADEDQPEIIDVGGKPGESSADSAEKESSSSAESVKKESSKESSSDSAPADGSFSAKDMSVTLNGNKLSCGDDFLPYVDKMGIVAKIEEGQACLEGGFDTNYYYGKELAVYTVAKGGKQLIYDIYITGSKFPDNKGVTVGKTTRDEVHKLYGEPTETLPGADEYISGKKMLSFEFENEVVSGISFSDTSVN